MRGNLLRLAASQRTGTNHFHKQETDIQQIAMFVQLHAMAAGAVLPYNEGIPLCLRHRISA